MANSKNQRISEKKEEEKIKTTGEKKKLQEHYIKLVKDRVKSKKRWIK